MKILLVLATTLFLFSSCYSEIDHIYHPDFVEDKTDDIKGDSGQHDSSISSFRGEAVCQLLDGAPGRSLRSWDECHSVFYPSGICSGIIKTEIDPTDMSLIYDDTGYAVYIPEELYETVDRLLERNIRRIHLKKSELSDYLEGFCNMSVDFNKRTRRDYSSLAIIGSEATWNKLVFSSYGLTSDLRKMKAFLAMRALMDSGIVRAVSNPRDAKYVFGLRAPMFLEHEARLHTIYYVVPQEVYERGGR